MPRPRDIWLAAGVRTPFGKVDGPTAAYDAVELAELAAMAKGSRAIVSICADGGQGSVLLLEAA